MTGAHVMRPWSAQRDAQPLAIAGGRGSKLWDYDGTEYLDFSSQLVYANVGHLHPKLVLAIQEQAATLPVIAPAHANLTRARAAAAIADVAPPGMSRVFFTNGGADANENAIRMARDHTGRPKIVSFYHSYHGATGAAVNATGDWRRQRNEYGVGHIRAFGPYLFRSLFGSNTEEEECERSLHYLESLILHEGADTIAGIIMEPIVGSSGLLLPPSDYLKGVRKLASRYGIVLIFDEVMTGFGRTGSWFAFEQYGVVPDLITFAKGVNSGYVPAGGVILSDNLAATWEERSYPGGLTYSGHPLAMSSIVANIEILKNENLLENASELGTRLIGPRLQKLMQQLPWVGDVRGLGLLWALELVADPESRQPLPASVVAEVAARAREAGVLVLAVENRIHIAPPLVATWSETERGLDVVERAIESISIHNKM